ncbi:imelysin family protein [Saccharophagus degradans]|uniref:Imelysin family protein n=1 Tax=Saccharophagus degradans TaxID=86304 RepID=A0AAW7X774_9GAMM|nr:imelysin family protein [Saccharophagus degradans]MDO6423419.1 imelysin family protein [Saccharophagus degradans]MDO6606824.1 imelysin family protein [Saccharophagus degradans]WGO98244.1 imelysin family protein [Saccharophagus degradans]
MTRFRHKVVATLTCLGLLVLGGCDKTEAPATEVQPEPVEATPPAESGSAQALWASGSQILNQSLSATQALNGAITTLLNTPSEDALLQAQKAWATAAITYQEFNVFAQLQPQNSVLFNTVADNHYRIAAHPIQPGYLDSFGDYQYSGIVHDISMPLNKATLLNQHGMTDLEDAALGFYAIEYMLFGYQNTRTIKDYIAHLELTSAHQTHGYQNLEETPNNRRRLLLQLQNDILLEDMHYQADYWQSPALSNEWLTLSPKQHYSVVVHAFKQSASSLLLEVIEAAKSNQQAAGTSPDRVTRDRVKMSLSSLKHALPVIPSDARTQLASALDLAVAASASPQPDWHKTVYEQLMIITTANI